MEWPHVALFQLKSNPPRYVDRTHDKVSAHFESIGVAAMISHESDWPCFGKETMRLRIDVVRS